MGTMIKVGMADMNICLPPDSITTLGLGSCVGVVIYDPAKKNIGYGACDVTGQYKNKEQ